VKRNVREAVVDQQLAFLGVHLDQHSICCLPLAAVAGHCVTIVSVRVLGKLIPNQSVLTLNGTQLRLAKLHVTHS
jgi:hypothetical protein